MPRTSIIDQARQRINLAQLADPYAAVQASVAPVVPTVDSMAPVYSGLINSGGSSYQSGNGYDAGGAPSFNLSTNAGLTAQQLNTGANAARIVGAVTQNRDVGAAAGLMNSAAQAANGNMTPAISTALNTVSPARPGMPGLGSLYGVGMAAKQGDYAPAASTLVGALTRNNVAALGAGIATNLAQGRDLSGVDVAKAAMNLNPYGQLVNAAGEIVKYFGGTNPVDAVGGWALGTDAKYDSTTGEIKAGEAGVFGNFGAKNPRMSLGEQTALDSNAESSESRTGADPMDAMTARLAMQSRNKEASNSEDEAQNAKTINSADEPSNQANNPLATVFSTMNDGAGQSFGGGSSDGSDYSSTMGGDGYGVGHDNMTQGPNGAYGPGMGSETQAPADSFGPGYGGGSSSGAGRDSNGYSNVTSGSFGSGSFSSGGWG